MATATRSKVSVAAAELPESRPSSRASKTISARTSETSLKHPVSQQSAKDVSPSGFQERSPSAGGKSSKPQEAGSAASILAPSVSRTSVSTWTPDLDTPGTEQQLHQVASATPASEAEEGNSRYPPPSVSERQLRELPPVDGGVKAWKYLAAASILEAIVWGYATSFGILLDSYLRSDLGRQPNAQTLLPLIGTANTGTMYCLSPFVAAIINRYPATKGWLMYLGLALATACLIGASFAGSAVQLLVSQGFGYGVGGVLLYYPAMSFLPEWFVARRGFANGFIFAGTGAGGLVFPFILEGLLSRFSLATTLQAVAVGSAAAVLPCIPFIRPRVPPGKATGPRRPNSGSILGDRTALKSPILWVFLVANTFQGIAYFLPPLYLPTYTRSLSAVATAASGSAVLSALNATSIVSRAGIGILSDRYRPHLLGALLLLAGSVSIAALWGGAGATGLAALIVFSALFGLTAGGWTSLYFAVVRECSDENAAAITLYGAFSLTRGIGNILAGPVGSRLLLTPFDAPEGSGFAIADDAYSSMILFCALAMGTAGLIEAGLASFSKPKQRLE